jgi:hypothetical protein
MMPAIFIKCASCGVIEIPRGKTDPIVTSVTTSLLIIFIRSSRNFYWR